MHNNEEIGEVCDRSIFFANFMVCQIVLWSKGIVLNVQGNKSNRIGASSFWNFYNKNSKDEYGKGKKAIWQ